MTKDKRSQSTSKKRGLAVLDEKGMAAVAGGAGGPDNSTGPGGNATGRQPRGSGQAQGRPQGTPYGPNTSRPAALRDGVRKLLGRGQSQGRATRAR